MTRFNCKYTTGKTLHGKVRTQSDVYVQSNIVLTESPAGNGVYHGHTTSALNIGDLVAIYDVLTSDVAPIDLQEYDYANAKTISDLTIADTVIDDIYSDTAVIIAKQNSDMTIVKSDITSVLSELNSTQSDIVVADAAVDKIYSDTTVIIAKQNSDMVIVKSDITATLSELNTAQSDIALVYDKVRTTTHIYNLESK